MAMMRIIALLMLGSWCTLAVAELDTDADTSLSASAELGITVTTGNSDTSSVKGRLRINHEFERWRNVYLVEVLRKEDSEVLTAERYFSDFQSNYSVTKNNYFFINGNYEIDPFSGYAHSVVAAAGYGRRLYHRDDSFLDAELGPGYIYRKFDRDEVALAGASSEDSWLIHLAANAEVDISSNAKFRQLLIIDFGDTATARSETSLSANIIDSLAMKFTVIVRYNNNPLDNKKSTDTETSVTLLYSF